MLDENIGQSTMAESSNRIYEFDLLKIITCLFVIGIHCLPYENNYVYVLIFERIAVPIFFIISGFLWEGMDRNRKDRYLKRLICILLFSTVLYLVTDIRSFLSGLGLKKLLFVLFITGVRQHLWFLVALIEILLIKKWTKPKMSLIIFLFSAVSLISIYYIRTSQNGFSSGRYYLLDNCFVAGLMVEMGGVCYRLRLRKKKQSNNALLFGLLAVLSLLYYCECLYLIRRYQFIPQNASILLYCITFLIIHICTNINKIKFNNILLISSQATLYVYIIHPMIRDFSSKIFCFDAKGIVSFLVTAVISFSISLIFVIASKVEKNCI